MKSRTITSLAICLVMALAFSVPVFSQGAISVNKLEDKYGASAYVLTTAWDTVDATGGIDTTPVVVPFRTYGAWTHLIAIELDTVPGNDAAYSSGELDIDDSASTSEDLWRVTDTVTLPPGTAADRDITEAHATAGARSRYKVIIDDGMIRYRLHITLFPTTAPPGSW